MFRSKKFGVAAILAMVVGLLVFASPALATGPTVLAQVNPGGVPAAGLHVVATVNVPTGTTIYNSGKTRSGQIKYYPYKTRPSDKFVQVSDGTVRKWNCANPVKFTRPAHVVSGPVKMVAKFDIHVTVDVNIHQPKPAPKVVHVKPKPKQATVYTCTAIKVQVTGTRQIMATLVTKTKNTTFVGATWDFGDKTPAVPGGKTASHTYAADGIYTVAAKSTYAVGGKIKTRLCVGAIRVSGAVVAPSPTPMPTPAAPSAAVAIAPGGAAAAVNSNPSASATVDTKVSQSCRADQDFKGYDANGTIICVNNTNVNNNVIPIVVAPVQVVNVVTPVPAPTPTLTPAPAPAPQAPALSNPTNPEEIFSNGETYPNICVTVSAKAGNNIILTFGSKFGSFSTSTITFTSTGVDKKCGIYRAPLDSSAVGKSEVISFNAYDSTTGLRATEVTSMPFPIKAPKVNP